MGVTIHYSGKVDDVNAIDDLCDELVDFTQTLGWRFERLDQDQMKKGSAVLRGVVLYPHDDSEPLWLTFDCEGFLCHPATLELIEDRILKKEAAGAFTKTQFAPIETHISIVKLLQHLKRRYISNLRVHDEGGYWDTGDADELKRRLGAITRGLDVLQAALSANQDEFAKAQLPEDIAKLIEKIFKEKLGG